MVVPEGVVLGEINPLSRKYGNDTSPSIPNIIREPIT
jgi:hypothetical protein